jgi:hypothetical protein
VRTLAAVLALVVPGSVAAASTPAARFEPNLGQTDPRVRFLARGGGYVLFLTPTEAMIAPGGARQALRMKLVDADPSAPIAGSGLLPGTSHYFVGNEPAAWVCNVPSYERVAYHGVYPGVDLLYYGNEGKLEYDFVVAPGADPRRIELEFSGVASLRLDASGHLLLRTRDGELVQHKPVVYQVVAGARRDVAGRYVVRGKRRVGFKVARYDRTKPLRIDPILSYSTYLGGGDTDAGHAITVDSAGNAYVTGETDSINFPVTTGSSQGSTDAFVTKFDPNGTSRLYSVYLGGDSQDIGYGIAVDAAGNAHITGQTASDNFPTTLSGYQRVKRMGPDAFVTKLNAAGAIVYSTFLGGNGPDQGDRGNGVAVDSAGNMVVTGRTDSSDFPNKASVPPFNTFHGFTFDAFVAKLNPAASGNASLVYSAFIGGSVEDAGFGVALDSAGNPHIAGGTSSPDFPVLANAYQGFNNAGGTDAFFIKLNATATAILYSTYLGGGASKERASGIALDSAGQVYLAGQTEATDFPTKNAAQPGPGGLADAFVAKLDPFASGNASLVYATYLGGTANDTGRAIALDASGRAYVTGQTASATSFPLTNALQSYGGGTYDAFVTKLNPAGNVRLYSTFLGGSGDEGTGPTLQGGHGIAVSPCGDAWVTGRTSSTNFSTPGTAQPIHGGGIDDAFVSRIGDTEISGLAPRWGPTAGGTSVSIVGGCFRPGATVTIGGAPATGVSVVSPSVITATTPPHAAGMVNVVVTNPSQSPVTLVNGFTYGATGFFTLAPCRVIDTRLPNGPLAGPALAASTTRTFTVTGACGIPATAKALSVNITVTQSSAQGHLRLYPGGTTSPLVSSINYLAGQTRANNATFALGPGGTVAVRCVQASGSVQFLLDVNGYFQ